MLVLATHVPHPDLLERLLAVVLPRVDRDRLALDQEVPLELDLVGWMPEQGFAKLLDQLLALSVVEVAHIVGASHADVCVVVSLNLNHVASPGGDLYVDIITCLLGTYTTSPSVGTSRSKRSRL